MERSAWTDERLNDLAATLDTSVKLVHDEIRALREDTRQELRGLREEVREDFRDLRQDIRDLRADFSAWQRQIAQIGWALAAALIGAVVAIIIALA
ncbi:MAG: hypothetical protein E6G07_02035 [Actinobacteria bacterium]|nr:MAG: hypothetical protein E6G53_11775 [Actinomycetota bacterium]TML83010.1 MAG: hypothetical protein E6G07_02035 [Actinomycetota bacterium]